jgi:hypothetical protein
LAITSSLPPFTRFTASVNVLRKFERHQVRFQPDRQVKAALTADEHRPAAKHPVVDVPQPGGVLARRVPWR